MPSKVRIQFRADGAFSEEPLLAWCENHQVEYVIGLASNSRLLSELEQEQREMALASAASGESERTYRDLQYRTLDSWSQTRRVVAKIEHLPGAVGGTVSVEKAAKGLIKNWRWEYNHFRPHSALGYRPPAPEAIEPPPLRLVAGLT